MSSEGATDFGILLNVAFGVFKAGMREHMTEAGFDDLGPSFGYVFRLLDSGPRNLRLVAEELGITPQGALKIVNEMVEKGYIERRDDPEDGRVKSLRLTPRGSKALAEARRFHRRFEKELAGRVGKQRAAAARLALEDIVASGAEAAPKPRPL